MADKPAVREPSAKNGGIKLDPEFASRCLKLFAAMRLVAAQTMVTRACGRAGLDDEPRGPVEAVGPVAKPPARLAERMTRLRHTLTDASPSGAHGVSLPPSVNQPAVTGRAVTQTRMGRAWRSHGPGRKRAVELDAEKRMKKPVTRRPGRAGTVESLWQSA